MYIITRRSGFSLFKQRICLNVQDGSVITLVIADAFSERGRGGNDEEEDGDEACAAANIRDLDSRPEAVTRVSAHLKSLPSRRRQHKSDQAVQKSEKVKKVHTAVASAQGDGGISLEETETSSSSSGLNSYEVRVRDEKRAHVRRRFR